MSYQVEVQNSGDYPVQPNKLVIAVQTVLRQQSAAEDSGLTLVITDNAQVAALNKQFRNVDAPTDVLSFPTEQLPAEVTDEPPYLGDLLIAYPYAAAQAARLGHDLHDSLSLLAVHGTLHLLGHDHDTAPHRQAMWEAQAQALRALNISTDIVPTLEGIENGEDGQ